MFFNGLNEVLMFMGFLAIGLVFGIGYYLVLRIKHKIVRLVSLSSLGVILTSIFFYLILILNYGVPRFYMIFGVGIGILISFLSLAKIVAKFVDFWYNKFNENRIKECKEESKHHSD